VVRVRTEQTSIRWRKPHLRTPGYIHGVLGVIERECQVGDSVTEVYKTPVVWHAYQNSAGALGINRISAKWGSSAI
jgi:hypothetical protein